MGRAPAATSFVSPTLGLAPPPLPTRSGGGGGGGGEGAEEAADFEGEDGGGAAAAARYSLGASAASTGEAAAFYNHSRALSHEAREARIATRAKTTSLLLSREFRAR